MMRRHIAIAASVLSLAGAAAILAQRDSAHVALRSRVQLFRGGNAWNEVHADYQFDPAKSAVIVCDMWDKHWCTGANVRVAALVKRMEPFLESMRRKGVIIVHAPSDTMAYYANTPQRAKMVQLPHITPPEELKLTAPPLPIDDSRGGCDTPGETEHQAWQCENPGLRIAPEDYISDNGQEIYNLLRARSIETVFYTGVHANMCILNRTFAIRQMTKWGVRCILLRDLTDAMYNPQDAPHVSHAQGTELVIQYIEKYWSPTALSRDVQEAMN
jgi:nicotinamidase-related amidase